MEAELVDRMFARNHIPGMKAKDEKYMFVRMYACEMEHAVKVYISLSRGVATNVTHLGLKRKKLKLH